MLDNIELVDSVSNAQNTGKIHSNLIRLKKTSFSKISDKWRKFRISLLEKKIDRISSGLEKEISKMGDISNQDHYKISDKTKLIAKLEEKIKILSRENVPANFVKYRAIKLKKDMISALRENQEAIYSVNSNEQSDYSEFGFTDFNNTEFGMAAAAETDENKEIVKDEDALTPEKIRAAIDDSFNELNKTEQEKNATNTIDEPVEFASTIEENVAEPEEIEFKPEEEKVEFNVNERTNDYDPMKDENFKVYVPKTEEEKVDYDPMKDENFKVYVPKTEEEKVDYDPMKDENFQVYVPRTQAQPVENIKVSSNESRPAKTDIFDEEGIAKTIANAYTPMTDSEVENARTNIEYDKYDGKTDYSSSDIENNNIRGDVVITPERDNTEENVSEYTFVDDKEEDVHFDFSDATAKDLNSAVSVVTSEHDLRAMMARAAELNAARAKTKAELEEARRVNADEEQRVLEAKKITEEKEAKKNQRIKLLQDYIEASKEDYEFNKQAIENAKAEAENNRRMVEEEKMKGSQIDKEISEIEAMMSPFVEDDYNNPQHIRIVK